MLVDSHCHIHDSDYPLDIKEVMARASQADVMQMICIGTSLSDSQLAIDFASSYEGVFASIGVHPHNASEGWDGLEKLLNPKNSSVVAVGEIGLDYFYNHSPKDIQIKALDAQIELALKHNLPIIFHIREAFDDFWPIFDNFQSTGRSIRGVMHCFTDTAENAQKCLERGLFIGVNGYSTFVKDESQKAMFASLPIEKLLLETDAPYLTPTPFRGKINEPAFVRNIADYHAMIRNISFDEVAITTTKNACQLFDLKN